MVDDSFWSKYFKVYDVLNIVIPYSILLDFFIESLELKSGDLVLDAGAGTGNLSIKIISKGSDVFAVDNNRVGLEVAKSKNQKIKTIIHDISRALPFPDNFFDKIASNNVIYTIPKENRQSVFNEFYRVLRPGGIIVVSNVRKGWSPFDIYKEHLKIESKSSNVVKLFFRIVRMLLPTFKMFFYNFRITKEYSNGAASFVEPGEQKGLMEKSGFINISPDIMVYANQAILNKGFKSKNE